MSQIKIIFKGGFYITFINKKKRKNLMQLKKILVALTCVLIENGNALKIREGVQIEEGLSAQS